MATTNLGRVRFRPRGDYNPAADPLYSLLDLVSDGGGSFVYINETPSNEPTSSTSHWQQIASIGGQDLVDAAVAARDAAQGYKDAAAASAAQLAAGLLRPKGTYANLAALNSGTPSAANPNEIYITLDDGKWCYHNGSAWVAGGVFQAAAKGWAGFLNICTNPTFALGTTGWGGVDAVVGNVAEKTASAPNGNMYYPVPSGSLYRNHVLYFAIDLKADSDIVFVEYRENYHGSTKLYSNGLGEFERFSAVRTIHEATSDILIIVQDDRPSGWTKFYVRNATVLDLTAIFGAGNEPTEAEMTAMLAKVDGSTYGTSREYYTLDSFVPYLVSKTNEIAQYANGIDADLESTKSDLDDFYSNFIIKRNLLPAINEGKYYSAGNVGDITTMQSHVDYACGYFDVTDVDNFTVSTQVAAAFCHFVDADMKIVYSMSDYKIGTTLAYTVPDGVKYACITSPGGWAENGIVVLEGTDDIATTPVTVEEFPYNTLVPYADSLKLSNGTTLMHLANTVHRTYHVEKDGSGDFTSLVDAIVEATQYMDSVVYVGVGDYDLVEEFGEAYLDSYDGSIGSIGIFLKNRVHVIFASGARVLFNYTGGNTNTETHFSPFNSGEYGFTLENAWVESINSRYSVHDERNSASEPYHNIYKRCTFIHDSSESSWGAHQAIGGGLGLHGDILLEDCYASAAGEIAPISWHNAALAQSFSKIVVRGCYINGTFRVSNYGTSTVKSIAYCSGCSLSAEPILYIDPGYADNMELYAWNNIIRN